MISDPALLSRVQTKCVAICPKQFQLAKPRRRILAASILANVTSKLKASVLSQAKLAKRLPDDPDRDEELMAFSGYLRSLLVAASGRQTKQLQVNPRAILTLRSPSTGRGIM